MTTTLVDPIEELLAYATGTGANRRTLLQRLINLELESIQEKFDAARSEGVDVKAVEALLEVANLDKQLSEIGGQVGGLKSTINEKLTERFALEGVQSMNVNGSTVYKQVERYANAKGEFRHDLVQWARENDLDDMIVLQPARFKAWCREQLESETSRGLPPEIADKVEIFEKASLRIRKA